MSDTTIKLVTRQSIADLLGATEFSASASYTAGDKVLYGNKAYRFTAAHSGAWDAADVEELVLSSVLAQKRDMTDRGWKGDAPLKWTITGGGGALQDSLVGEYTYDADEQKWKAPDTTSNVRWIVYNLTSHKFEHWFRTLYSTTPVNMVEWAGTNQLVDYNINGYLYTITPTGSVDVEVVTDTLALTSEVPTTAAQVGAVAATDGEAEGLRLVRRVTPQGDHVDFVFLPSPQGSAIELHGVLVTPTVQDSLLARYLLPAKTDGRDWPLALLSDIPPSVTTPVVARTLDGSSEASVYTLGQNEQPQFKLINNQSEDMVFEVTAPYPNGCFTLDLDPNSAYPSGQLKITFGDGVDRVATWLTLCADDSTNTAGVSMINTQGRNGYDMTGNVVQFSLGATHYFCEYRRTGKYVNLSVFVTRITPAQ